MGAAVAGDTVGGAFLEARSTHPPPADDPWAPLDPHETGGGPALAPFRRLTTYRRPASLSAAAAAGRGKGAAARRTQATPTESIASFCASSCEAAGSTFGRSFTPTLGRSTTPTLGRSTAAMLLSPLSRAAMATNRMPFTCTRSSCSPRSASTYPARRRQNYTSASAYTDSNTRRLPSSAALKPEYPEFAGLYWAEQKRRSAAQKTDRAAIAALKQRVNAAAVLSL